MGSYEFSNLSEDMPPNITPESISEDASPDSTFFLHGFGDGSYDFADGSYGFGDGS